MSQPEPNRDSEAFLSALADHLLSPTGDLLTRRHVAAAAAAAGQSPPAGLRHLRWAAAMLAVFALLGTGGIAVAGGLPASMQGLVADVARALPLPFHVPYPPGEPYPAGREPEDGEVELEGFIPTTTPAPAPEDDPALPFESGPVESRHPDQAGDDRLCDLGRSWTGDERLDDEDWRELRDEIEERCGLELIAPPSYTDGSDDDREGDRDHHVDDHGDRSREGAGDREHEESEDGDSDWSEEEGSDGSEESDRERQEDGDHDGDDDEGRSGQPGDGRD
jgi:hypothetical protein